MKYNAKELWNSNNETGKLIKASYLYSEKVGLADKYFDEYVNEEDYDEPINELLDELELDYMCECSHDFRNSKYWDTTMWEEDEETWKGTDEEYNKLLADIEFLR